MLLERVDQLIEVGHGSPLTLNSNAYKWSSVPSSGQKKADFQDAVPEGREKNECDG